jgi:hypothetical protein
MTCSAGTCGGETFEWLVNVSWYTGAPLLDERVGIVERWQCPSNVGQSDSGSPNQGNTEPSKVTMSATSPSTIRTTSRAIGV